MKKNETQKITVRTKWQMLTSATDLVFALYNGMQGGGVENPMAVLGNNRGQAAPDKLGALTRAGLIENDEGRWELSQNVFEFLESLAGTSDEANVKTILGNRDTLERNVSYYFTAKKEESDPSRYLALVRRNRHRLQHSGLVRRGIEHHPENPNPEGEPGQTRGT